MHIYVCVSVMQSSSNEPSTPFAVNRKCKQNKTNKQKKYPSFKYLECLATLMCCDTYIYIYVCVSVCVCVCE